MPGNLGQRRGVSSRDRLRKCQSGHTGGRSTTPPTYATIYPCRRCELQGPLLAVQARLFGRIKAAAASRLVIHVGANGGGDDDMWKDRVLRYIATRPYKQGSTYLKRERTGSVTPGTIVTPAQPVPAKPFLPGEVTVLIGPMIYSSAALFSNVVRNYGFRSLSWTAVWLEPDDLAKCRA